MKKVLFALILIVVLAAALIVAFIRYDGGKYLKKAAKETFEVGEDIEKLTEKMAEKEKKMKKDVSKKLDAAKKVIK